MRLSRPPSRSQSTRGPSAPASRPRRTLGAIVGADFFTTEVWTWRGLVTYETVFVIDLASRRVQILGSTPHPEAVFMQQAVRTLTMADASALPTAHILKCRRRAPGAAGSLDCLHVRTQLVDVGGADDRAFRRAVRVGRRRAQRGGIHRRQRVPQLDDVR